MAKSSDMIRARVCLTCCGCVVLCAAAVAGCGTSEPATPTGKEGKMVYVDTVTKKAQVMEVAEAFPAVQPLTGKRTLMPGMYCPKCSTWHPVPPPDQINRTPRATVCPKTGAALTVDGPWPEEAPGAR